MIGNLDGRYLDSQAREVETMSTEDMRVMACWSRMLVAYSWSSHDFYLKVSNLLLCMESGIESCADSRRYRRIAEMKHDHIAKDCCSGELFSYCFSCTFTRAFLGHPELAPTFDLLQQREHQRTAKGQCNEHHVNTHSSQWRTSQSHTKASSSIGQPGIASARAIS